MASYRIIMAAVTCALLTSACGNTVYGPRRLIQGGYVDDGNVNGGRRNCPTVRQLDSTGNPLNLTHRFFDLACDSLRDPRNTALANAMMDAGITLNRMRCNDFFAQRAGNQTRERILRGAIAPVSALITGIIGVSDFATDAGRREAIQILGIGESATVAGLELYETEFLFGSENINSVRTLTMRAADEHAAGILAQPVGFYAAARHLIDHQMICTPANILELAQSAIREGRIASATPIRRDHGLTQAADDQATIARIETNLQVEDLTGEQFGSLWWLSELVKGGAAISQDTLTVIQARLAGLPVNPIRGSAGALTVDTALVQQFTPLFDQLSTATTSGMLVTARRLEAKIAETAPASVLERTSETHFQFATAPAPTGRAVEVGVEPESSDDD